MTTTSSETYWRATATLIGGVPIFEPTTDIVIQIQPSTFQQTTSKHTPGFKLTQDERAKKSDQHKFGLCCDCDAGLDDRADFICDNRSNGGFALMCNACNDYYTNGGHLDD
jgi:hypothetical protein